MGLDSAETACRKYARELRHAEPMKTKDDRNCIGRYLSATVTLHFRSSRGEMNAYLEDFQDLA